jgi:hypothetical protein
VSAAADGFRHFRLPYDFRVLQDVHGATLHHGLLRDAVDVGEALTVPLGAVLVLAVLWLAWRRPALRWVALVVLAAALVAYAATLVGKPLVDRAPPYLAGRLSAGQHPGPVFPEGPGALAVAIGVGAWGRWRLLSLLALAFAAEDGLVQLGHGSHWPSDLYASWLIGLAAGLAGRAVSRRRGAFRGS